MRLNVEVDSGFSEAVGAVGSALRDAADAAVEAVTEQIKGGMRVVIEAALGSRAANALRSRYYFGEHQEVRGLVHSKWWRTPAAGGAKVDMLGVFERGGVVASPFGGALAIPLPPAYNVMGLAAYSWRGRQMGSAKAVTPQAVEIKLGQRLGIVKSKQGHILLVARDVVRSSSRRGTVRSGTFVDKRGRERTRRGTKVGLVPMFVLVRSMLLPKRLDFSAIRAGAGEKLTEKFLVELAKRDL